MRVVVAPDGFGGTLSAREAAEAIAAGWTAVRPDDEVVLVPLSDGGEGLLEVLVDAPEAWRSTEVAGPQGHPVDAAWLLRTDETAVIEMATASGLHLLPKERRTPRLATSYGVGQLLDAARRDGAHRILLGLGGSANVDGGAGALSALGFRLTVEDGSGLKIGGDDLGRVAAADRGWAADWSDVEVVLLCDVDTVLADAATVFGPQKGASPEEIVELTEALLTWADVAERDLAARPWRDQPGTGAAGGLGFGLACGLPNVSFVSGIEAISGQLALSTILLDADIVVTGEGRLDATSAGTKVVGHVARAAAANETPVLAVVGQIGDGAPKLDDVEAAAPDGPGDDPHADVVAAARRLATRVR